MKVSQYRQRHVQSLATVLLLSALVGFVSSHSLFDEAFDGFKYLTGIGSSRLGSLDSITDLGDAEISLATRRDEHLSDATKTSDDTKAPQPTSNCDNADGCGDDDPDTKRSVTEIITSRGFGAESHDVITSDGYIITIQRIINPLVDADYRSKLYPVILQHGLFSSAADWVINSVYVRPQRYPNPSASSKPSITNQTIFGDSQEQPNSLGFYLANEGYDVWLATIRGNTYAQRHVNMSSWNPKFWSFTFDEHIEKDLPAIIKFVVEKTNHKTVGYVGHSQGSIMAFGLLADKPEYANILKPVVALAPVAFVDNTVSPVKYFKYYTPLAQHINLWFSTSNIAVKYLTPIVCGPKVVRDDICSNLLFLTVGFDMGELDTRRISAYVHHTPAGTSVKNIAHYGQELFSKRFAHFDHGIAGNLMKYGTTNNPDYDLSRIKSDSLALFVADNDWLAVPKDVKRLRESLKVKPFLVYNVSEIKPKWNHIDFLYGKSCGQVVNTKVIEVFNHFRS